MGLKAVLFDIDGVLIDSVKANAVFFERLFKQIGDIRYSKRAYTKVNYMTMYDIIKHFSKDKSDAEVRKIWLYAKKLRYPFGLIKIPKDAVHIVGLLSKDYKLAVVTGRIRTSADRVLKLYGYNKYIKKKVSYEDYKRAKPHPESLLIALRKLKIKPSEAVYMGDMETDVVCAKAAGVKSILYKNYYSEIKRSKPDYTVTSFKQLYSLLEQHAR